MSKLIEEVEALKRNRGKGEGHQIGEAIDVTIDHFLNKTIALIRQHEAEFERKLGAMAVELEHARYQRETRLSQAHALDIIAHHLPSDGTMGLSRRWNPTARAIVCDLIKHGCDLSISSNLDLLYVGDKSVANMPENGGNPSLDTKQEGQ